MIKIDEALVSKISEKGKASDRRRTMHNFHSRSDDPVQRMINAIEPWSYVRPHKHENPDKREVFIILRGSLLVVEFDDAGRITDHIILNAENKIFGVEIAPQIWHTIISLEKKTAVYELKDGPYIPLTDKDFAAWAPKESEVGTKEYIENILTFLGITTA
ncbi:MAG: WbuC family cupin fold metalloprotein [Bacteroidia bacterium]|nr:WbuC family cupin fold metalloprotein [Bacteroidia bacterium]